MIINQEQIIATYIAAECEKEGTPLFLDEDGDIALARGGQHPMNLPDHVVFLCNASPGTFQMPHFNVYKKDDEWKVAGYGNAFNEKKEALVFALQQLGADGEVLDDFIEHLRDSIEHSVMVA